MRVRSPAPSDCDNICKSKQKLEMPTRILVKVLASCGFRGLRSPTVASDAFRHSAERVVRRLSEDRETHTYRIVTIGRERVETQPKSSVSFPADELYV